jgi:hypothetical protein
VISDSVWIVGTSRSGKTARLTAHFCQWLQTGKQSTGLSEPIVKVTNLRETDLKVLVLAANDDNRRELRN